MTQAEINQAIEEKIIAKQKARNVLRMNKKLAKLMKEADSLNLCFAYDRPWGFSKHSLVDTTKFYCY